jgi:hypothetical protein
MNWTANSVMALAVLLSVASGAELKPETIHEWEDYLARADARMMDRMQRNFLWVDESEQRLQHVRSAASLLRPYSPEYPSLFLTVWCITGSARRSFRAPT